MRPGLALALELRLNQMWYGEDARLLPVRGDGGQVARTWSPALALTYRF